MKTIINFIIHFFSDFDNTGRFQVLKVDVEKGYVFIDDRSFPRDKYKITVCKVDDVE